MVQYVKEWWGGCEEEKKWMEETEAILAYLRPLAGGLAISKTQKERNEVNVHAYTCTCTLSVLLITHVTLYISCCYIHCTFYESWGHSFIFYTFRH